MQRSELISELVDDAAVFRPVGERVERWSPGRIVCAALLSLTGALIGIDILVLGNFPVGEIVLLFALGLVQFLRIGKTVDNGMSLRTPLIRLLLVCQILATLSLVVADLWRESYPTDYLRGWMRMVLLFLDIVAFATMAARGQRVLMYFQYGLIFSGVSLTLHPPLFNDYWKFGFATGVSTLVIIGLPKVLFRPLILAALGALAVLNVVLSYRSMGVLCGFTGLLSGLMWIDRRWRFKAGLALLVLAVILLVVGKSVVLERHGDGASRSDVERAAMIEAAWEGFVGSPLIGQGSWFSRSNVMNRFLEIRAIREIASGEGLGFDANSYEGAAIHSQILVSLAEGGLVGGLFFLVYIGMLCRALWLRVMVDAWTAMAPIELFVVLNGIYDAFLSPFSGGHRLFIAFAAVLSVVIISRNACSRPGIAI